MQLPQRFQRPWVLLLAATTLEGWLIYLGLTIPGQPMGDLTLAYEPWMQELFGQHLFLGISTPWVYPVLALMPMAAAHLAGWLSFTWGWFAIQYLTLILALILLVSPVGSTSMQEDSAQKTARFMAAYAWLAALLLMGPVSISRIDFFSAALVIVAASQLLGGGQKSATILLTIAGWIKVWPVAIFLAVWSAATKKLRLVIWAASLSGGILILGFLLGANASIFSFITGQTNRGIQIESPWATWWLFDRIFGNLQSGIAYNRNLQTFEVFGANTQIISTLLGSGQLVAVAITAWLGWRAFRRGARASEIVVWVSLTATLDLIFFNKVGSPQFIGWLAVCLAIGLMFQAKKFGSAAGLILATAALTGFVYPILYNGILASDFFATGVLLARNLLLLAALVLANQRLSKLQPNAEPSPLAVREA